MPIPNFAKRQLFSLSLYGVTGLLIPAALATVLTISEGGYIYENQSGIVVFSPMELIRSPYSWAVVFWRLSVFCLLVPAFNLLCR